MTLNTNRLNLPYMVDNQLKDALHPRRLDRSFIGQRMSSQRKNMIPKTKIETSVNSIYATVHNNLRVHKATKPLALAPSIPQPIANTMKRPENPVMSVECNKLITNFGGHTSRSPNNAKSIPQLTIDLESKCQQRLHRSITNPHGMNSYEQQQRAKEIVRQKRILEEMLEQNQTLQSNRLSVKMEIQSMKKYLNEIRQKLDQSLRKLEANKTICGPGPKPKKPLAVAKTTGPYNGGDSVTNSNKARAPSASKLVPIRRNNQRRVSLDRRLM